MSENTIPALENGDQKEETRFETRNSTLFNIFRVFGFFPMRWNTDKKMYITQKCYLIPFYLLWVAVPFIGFGLALGYHNKVQDYLNDINDKDHDFIAAAILMLGLAVIPTISTQAMKLVAKSLPEVLEDIAALFKKDIWYKTPMDANIFTTSKKKKLSSGKKKREVDEYHNKTNRIPVIRVLNWIIRCLSLVGLIVLSTIGATEVSGWSTFKEEWPFFLMVWCYLLQPVVTTWFCAVFIQWLRRVYEVLKIELDHIYHLKTGKISSDESTSVTFDEEKVKLLGEYVDKLQEIFLRSVEGFMKYITSINFVIFIGSSVFCTFELLNGFELIMYTLPLTCAFGHLAVICYFSNCLMNEYGRILLVLKKMLRHKHQDENNLLPYDGLHILRENLLDSPPQMVIFAGYPIGNGFLIAIQGFILSYAVLVNDILEDDPKNFTLTCNNATNWAEQSCLMTENKT